MHRTEESPMNEHERSQIPLEPADVTSVQARQVWLHGFPEPGRCEETAAQAERLGFDGLLRPTART